MRAEQLKSAFLEAQAAKDEWKLPVILNIGAVPPNTRRPPRFQIGIYEGDDGKNKVQLDVFDVDFVRDAEFDTQILATLLNELIDLKDVTANLVIGVPSFDFKDSIDPIALQQTIATETIHQKP